MEAMIAINQFYHLGEPTQPQVELIFDNVVKTYYKLKELGFTEVNGKIAFIDEMEGKR